MLTEFIPVILNEIKCSEVETRLLSLPTKLGGLSIPMFEQ